MAWCRSRTRVALTAICAGRALVGEGLAELEDAVVLVEGGRIRAVGARDAVPFPAGAEVVDATSLTLVPGFVDAHVHIGFYTPRRVVAGGVTTVRDLGWPPEAIFPLARSSRGWDFDGPTIVAAGHILTAPGGYPTRAAWAPPGTGHEVGDREEAGRAVAALHGAGAGVIKIALDPSAGPTLDVETLVAIVTAAHDRGLRVTGHVCDVSELDKALDAGVDELAHMLITAESIPDATIARMVAASLTIVPTMSIFSGRMRRAAVSNLARFIDAGGDVVYGTDLGNAGPQPGIDRAEVRGMLDAGMSLHDIVYSATVSGARWVGAGTTGVLEAGRDADIVGVRGDPLASERALTSVAAVWRRGRPRPPP